MRDLKEIQELKALFTTDLYKNVRDQQNADQMYYDDTFPVPEVKKPHQIYRSGLGVRIIDAPAEQIVTSNPQAFIDMRNQTTLEKISTVLNQKWIRILRRQNPNPFKESVKNPLLWGETFIRLAASPYWTINQFNTGLPVVFSVPNPMGINASIEEDENGIPDIVIVDYERYPSDILATYPEWTNPKKRGQKGKVKWFEFWDSETRYFEADGEDVLGGIKPNPYGFAPFIRRYSGFGRRSPDGDLSKLIVSDIRRSRDLLLEECATRSNIASIQFLFAHKDILVTSPGELNIESLRDNLKLGAYGLNVLDNLPPETKVELGLSRDMAQVSESTLQHHRDIIGELAQRHPFILAGFPYGSSGRQQDMVEVSAMRRYDSVVENTETMWATAFEKAFEICRKLNLVPEGLSEKEVESKFQCSVTLKAKDPLEEDRRITLGNRLWNMGNGSIDIGTFHTEFQGRTVEESKKIIARMLADKVTIFNPDVAQVMGMIAAQESGMERYLELAQQQQQQMTGLQKQLPPTGQERIQGEVETEAGMEQGTQGMRGARQSPTGYNRGG